MFTQTTAAPRKGLARFVPALGLMLVSTTAGLPAELDRAAGLGAPLLVGLAFAALFHFAQSRGQTLVALLVILWAGAYSVGMGDALERGIVLHGLYAQPQSVQSALLLVVLFLAAMSLSALASSRAIEALAGKLPSLTPAALSQRRGAAHFGLGVTLVLSFLVSLRTGAWTAYGAEVAEGRDGTFRLEFFYDPALLSAVALGTRALLDAVASRAKAGRKLLIALTLALVALLLFARQMRRLMLASVLMAVLMALDHPAVGRAYLGSLRRMLAGGALVVALVVALNFVSGAWRESALAFSTNDIAERLEDVGQRVGEPRDGAGDKSRDRFTYLWMDAVSVEHEPPLKGRITLEEMLRTSLILVTPKVLLPTKYRHPLVTCETAFADLRVLVDLPCTPSSEGYLAGGTAGVVFVALAWGPMVGLAGVLYRRRSQMSLLAAMHLLYPLTVIETSAFPIAHSLRVAVLGVAMAGTFGALWMLLTGWRHDPAPPGRLRRGAQRVT